MTEVKTTIPKKVVTWVDIDVRDQDVRWLTMRLRSARRWGQHEVVAAIEYELNRRKQARAERHLTRLRDRDAEWQRQMKLADLADRDMDDN